ncbi:hypothetical protein [uncultured Parolsenella sp.]|uniref:hypothetical protein n=1 Tax=uncultured Parolsenella sp. TaxID=2083008 RepID=UPI0025D6CAEA|nr:hypothetical protein [uncultured Parolsenella sp.]
MSEETTEAATVDETKAVAPAPDVPPVVVRRQSLATRMGVCDMRVGVGATAQLGEALRGVVGKPRRVLVAHSADVPADVVEEVRRSLIDTGFEFHQLELAGGRASRNLDEATRVFEALASHSITADDAIVAVGDAGLISTLVFVASTWCAGTVLAAVPTTLDGMVDVTVTPRALDVSAASEMLLAKGVVRLAVCDPANLPDAPDDPGTLMGRAVLVAGAVTAGETTFSELAVRADGIVAQDAETLVDEVLDITKSRCRVASSTALAVRQGLLLGMGFARAIGRCLDAAGSQDTPGEGRLLAEGLRIAARLAVAHQEKDAEALLDLVFAQDALLERFGLAEVPCDLDADDVLAALRAEELSRSNRFMLALPLDFGRIRLTNVPDDLLYQHLKAWCKARRKLSRHQPPTA